ncbi:MAG: cytochrome c biogenesis protein CcdA [Chloroflexota bacterium]|nr:cytochrome c biogenesis protein CcdA [Chloroflexota bacterium]MDE2687441.1 cytochrome c biogenesis protein CcdA [Chloroflexota bacterium]
MYETTASSDTQQAGSFARRVLLPIAAAAIALGIAIIGALIVRGDSDIDAINFFVESLSGGAARQVGGLGSLAGFGFAFGAGLAAAFNPCGFAMLPAYMGLYLGVGNEEETSFVGQIFKALLIGITVTVGFILLFAAAGAVIGLGARSVVGSVLPWIGLTVGVLLTIAGAWLLGGGKLYTALAQQTAEKFGNPGQANIRGYFIFGLAYGLASLSCTLPIFLAVIGSSFATSSIWGAFAQFILYAVGMGSVILTLTLGMSLFKGAMVGGMRKVMRYVEPVGTWLMLIAGTYIVFYWLTIGNVLG